MLLISIARVVCLMNQNTLNDGGNIQKKVLKISAIGHFYNPSLEAEWCEMDVRTLKLDSSWYAIERQPLQCP